MSTDFDIILQELDVEILNLSKKTSQQQNSSQLNLNNHFSNHTHYSKHSKSFTLESISILHDAFGGWLEKVSKSKFFKKENLKKKYIILANQTLYIFKTNDFKSSFEAKYPITSKTVVTKSLKPNQEYTLNFFTEYQEALGKLSSTNVEDDEDDDVLGLGIVGLTNTLQKSIQFKCKDEFELQIWLDLINEAIENEKSISINNNNSEDQIHKPTQRSFSISSSSTHATEDSAVNI
ncbi:hypothetical protein HDU92_008091 [Lobulomyces angularis]|nr:hypothetical protein HDU92_008091 [Lobulomyces angularis]